MNMWVMIFVYNMPRPENESFTESSRFTQNMLAPIGKWLVLSALTQARVDWNVYTIQANANSSLNGQNKTR